MAIIAVSYFDRLHNIAKIKRMYPRTYEAMKGIPGFLKSNPKFLNQLSLDTGMDRSLILKYPDVTSSKGQAYVMYDFHSKESIDLGYNTGTFGVNGEGGLAYISENYMAGLEKVKLETTIQATSFVLAVTVMHEFVHWARANHGGNLRYALPSNTPKGDDYGGYWEQNTFGTILTKFSAYDISQKVGWK